MQPGKLPSTVTLPAAGGAAGGAAVRATTLVRKSCDTAVGGAILAAGLAMLSSRCAPAIAPNLAASSAATEPPLIVPSQPLRLAALEPPLTVPSQPLRVAPKE